MIERDAIDPSDVASSHPQAVGQAYNAGIALQHKVAGSRFSDPRSTAIYQLDQVNSLTVK